jgi:hypothetical protein
MNLLLYILFIWVLVIPAAVVGMATLGAHRRERVGHAPRGQRVRGAIRGTI